MIEFLIRWIMIALVTVAAICVNRAAVAYDHKLASPQPDERRPARPRRNELTINFVILFLAIFALVAIVGTGSLSDIVWALPLTALVFGTMRLGESHNWVRLQRQFGWWEDDDDDKGGVLRRFFRALID